MRKNFDSCLFWHYCYCRVQLVVAQTHIPVKGVADKRDGPMPLPMQLIVKDAQTTLTNAILVIRDGKIVAVGHWHCNSKRCGSN
jgi:hypothetical protein